MSDNKRFYWLKLKEDFFEDDTIAWIEEQENGKEYVLFYLKLCLKALKNKGILIRYVGDILIPYDCASLAELTNTNIDTVKMAMVLFQKIGLINILDSGEIFLTQLQEMTGSETNKAELMRKKRAREKLKGNNVTLTLPERYPILDIDKDKEKELDKDIDNRGVGEEEEKKNTKPDYEAFVGVYNATHIHQVKKITPKRKTAVLKFTKDYNLDAFKEVCAISKRSEFLSGKNNNNWVAGFDWLIKTDNATKVLEGQYGGLEEKAKESMYDRVRKQLEEEEKKVEGGKIDDSC